MNPPETEPVAPEDVDNYTGNWADWIVPGPGPTRGSYEDRAAYDDYDDDPYDDWEDEDEPEPAHRAAPTGRLGLQERRVAAARHRLGTARHDTERTWIAPLLGVLAVLAVVAAIAVQVGKMSSSGEPDGPPAVALPTAETSGAQPAADTTGTCPSEINGEHVRGNGTGSHRSGAEVILAVQSRYYRDRSGQQVFEMFAPDAAAPTAAQIQAGIDTIPAGTTHCVQIMPGPFTGQHIMVVTETHPDGTRRTWPPQLVLTTLVGDKWFVASIVPLEEDKTPR
ncbi:hypothetical protein [Nocardia huaxiensis]|uniref:DUF8176 domain-containing protein n=1 Tax=Nocardia huaxiensis TaxID=2755382 RepID=A0A7D6ZUW1_9NOCA|nr:hypothetical protein [Nocardia huaxiensis]QLY29309.1 hypothetical protein H0264_29125 [Nocardia huaxiensis]UFS97215.1 hypothetical protein LPY97_04615 [Nocardia huaxiensis]